MTQVTPEEIQDRIYALGRKINAPMRLLRVLFTNPGEGRFVCMEDSRFILIDMERGHEMSRRETDSLDELLYWLMDNVVSTMAFDYELKNRNEWQDCRKIAFQKEEELFGKLNPAWKEKVEKKINGILRWAPLGNQIFLGGVGKPCLLCRVLIKLCHFLCSNSQYLKYKKPWGDVAAYRSFMQSLPPP
jgi:hypothetical protein